MNRDDSGERSKKEEGGKHAMGSFFILPSCFISGVYMFGEPMEIPKVGSYVSFMDPEGNRVSMLEPVPVNRHGPAKKPTPKAAAKKGGGKKKW
jgi:hypothetical protein